MAAVPAIAIPKSEPDISRLNGFTGHTVTVTKFTQPRGSVGQMVVPTSEMSLKQILALQTQLPLSIGPGFYRFTVSDTGGSGDDTWLVRLGPDTQQQQEVAMSGTMNGTTDANQTLGGGAPAGSRQIGPGYFYDEQLGTLVTPWRTIVAWRPGDELPKPPTTPATSHLASVPANATPWGGGWGGFPAMEVGQSSKERDLEQRLAEERRQREMDKIQADIRRVQDETNKTVAMAIEKLTTLVTAKPSGPSDEMILMRRQLDESERRREEDRRDQQQREREEQMRRELAATNERMEKAIREATANKTDPMMPMLMQILTQMQQSSAASVDSIREAVAISAQSTERTTQQMFTQLAGHTMTPTMLVSLLQSVKHDANEGSREIVGAMKEAMGVQKEVFTQMLDIAGQGAQPWYAGAISEGINKIGGVAAAISERTQVQQAAQQQQQIAMQQRQPPSAARQSPVMRPAPLSGPAAAPASMAGASMQSAPQQIASPNERPPGTAVDGDEFVLQDGRRIPMTIVQREGWGTVLGWPADVLRREIAALRPIAPAAAANTNGVSAPAAVHAEAATIIPPLPKKAKKRGKKDEQPEEPEELEFSPDTLRDTPTDIVRKHVMGMFKSADGSFNDEAFFGSAILPYLNDLRTAMPVPEQVATFVLQGRTQLQTFGGKMPPAIDLLEASQLEVLVERLFPVADVDYRDHVVAAIGNALEAEDAGDIDDGEDDSEE